MTLAAFASFALLASLASLASLAGPDAGFYHGVVVGKDRAAARHWFLQAAEQGSVIAARCLGTMLVKGEGGPMDVVDGRGFWERAAAEGCRKARKNMETLDAVLHAALSRSSFEMF